MKGAEGVIQIENPNMVKPKNMKARDADVSYSGKLFSGMYLWNLFLLVLFFSLRILSLPHQPLNWFCFVLAQLEKTTELSRRERLVCAYRCYFLEFHFLQMTSKSYSNQFHPHFGILFEYYDVLMCTCVYVYYIYGVCASIYTIRSYVAREPLWATHGLTTWWLDI